MLRLGPVAWHQRQRNVRPPGVRAEKNTAPVLEWAMQDRQLDDYDSTRQCWIQLMGYDLVVKGPAIHPKGWMGHPNYVRALHSSHENYLGTVSPLWVVSKTRCLRHSHAEQSSDNRSDNGSLLS